ncbi:hypothetical protein MY10362_008694 [Beauveria mimosiformis]
MMQYQKNVTQTHKEKPNSGGTNIAGGATHSTAGQQVYDHAKRATSPAGSASEGPPNTPQNGNEAAGAQYDVVEHATQLHELPKLDITDKDSKIRGELLNASLTHPSTNKNGVVATPEGSISPETQLANDDDPSTVFIQATSMDDIEGWAPVGEND